jgi:ketosteroid isomerase-like protein
MVEHTFVLQAENAFFAALMASDRDALEQLLDKDFVLIDLSGTMLHLSGFISALESGHLKFESIRTINSEVRLYGETAIVTGETEMRGTSKDQYFQAFSRYTHVYQEQADDTFLLVSAQGTLITREARP